jgi:tRNA pseudouridine-54 N-methylase
MKRILFILSASLVLAFVPLILLSAQEKKIEKKIKIIIDDGSGKKIMVDTLIKDGSDIETIKLSDGKVIIIGNHADLNSIDEHNGNKHVTVTVTSDDENGKKTEEVKEIRIISSDSADLSEKEVGKKIYVSTESKESTVNKTKFVVAKNGMVVTVEGEDEAKAKELIKIIEDHLGVK